MFPDFESEFKPKKQFYFVNNKKIASIDSLIQFYKNPKSINYEKIESWFPVYASKELAGLVADLMADGHLQGAPKWRMDYTSNSVKELERFQKIIFHMFGVKSKIRKCTTNKYGTMNLGINCKPLARLFAVCGVPSGAKTEKKYIIPEWITKNKTYFKKFISRYFSCEGSVDLGGAIDIHICKNINLVSNGILFMNQIKTGLNNFFDIKTTNPFLMKGNIKRKNKADSKLIRLKIKNKKGLLTFYKEIGFENESKNEKLKRLVMARR